VSKLPAAEEFSEVVLGAVNGVARPHLLKFSTSAPPLALFRFHYPRAYLTTSARPHTSLDSLDSYQTLSNPQTNAIARRPGAAAVYPSARLAHTEPPAAH
jgi:hypothetical protein